MRRRRGRHGEARTGGTDPDGRHREWVGGLVTVPGCVTDHEEPRRPNVAVWMELPERVIVAHEVVEPEQRNKAVGRLLSRAMEAPATGSPRRPDSVRVDDPELAGGLQEVLGAGIPVEVGPIPELAELFETTGESPEPAGEPDHLDGERTLPDEMERLVQNARLLDILAPWEQFRREQPLRVDIPDLGLEGGCVVLVGSQGVSRGFLLFPSLSAFEVFLDASTGVPLGRGHVDFGTDWLALEFALGPEVSPEVVVEAVAYGWLDDSTGAYPVLRRIERDGGIARPLGRDVRTVSACMGALNGLFARYGQQLDRDRVEPFSVSFYDEEDLEVRFTFPFQAFGRFEKESAEPRPARPSRGRVGEKVGRNDPCPCGSGLKYKNCCMGRDQAGQEVGRATAEETGVRIPDLDDRAREEAALASSWDADLITLPGQVESDPGKAVAMVLVVGAGRVLASQVLIGTPTEEQEVIELIENALRQAAGAVGAWPEGIIVRHHEVATVLDERLDQLEVGVWAVPDLVELDEVVRAMRADMGSDRPIQMDFGPTSWYGWGLGEGWVRSFFEAVSRFAERAPWMWIPGGYGFSIEAPSGRTWYGMVQWPEHPGGLERGGLFLCADPADHQGPFMNDEGEELWQDRVLGFFLADEEGFPDPVLDEIRDAGWEVLSTEAYPFLLTVNTPTGGLSRRDSEDLLTAVRILPDAVDEIGADLRYGEPTLWRDESAGVRLRLERVEDWGVEDEGAVHGDEMFPELAEVNLRIQQRIEEEGADSLDRVNKITSEEMTSYNRRPQEALGGLSPVRMRLLFDAGWDESDGIVRIGTDRPEEVIAASRFVRNTRRLLEAIGGEGGIPSTKKGNLSRDFAERMREEMEFDGLWASSGQEEVRLRGERDLLPLHKVRVLAQYADLIRPQPKEFVLTEQGRELLEEERAGDLLKLLLQVHFMELDLSEWDRYPETPEVQQSVSYMLYRFHQLDETWREADDLLEVLLPPGVLEYLEDQFDDSWRLPGLVSNRILNPFEAFGLAEKRIDEQERWLPAEYRPSTLLKEVVSFHFPRLED